MAVPFTVGVRGSANVPKLPYYDKNFDPLSDFVISVFYTGGSIVFGIGISATGRDVRVEVTSKTCTIKVDDVESTINRLTLDNNSFSLQVKTDNRGDTNHRRIATLVNSSKDIVENAIDVTGVDFGKYFFVEGEAKYFSVEYVLRHIFKPNVVNLP